ncbi:hypothetical protein [Treponema sp. R80B11-R83G3]
MKRLLFAFIGILFFAVLSAQEKNTLDWDIDDIFNESAQESPKKEPENNKPAVTVNKLIKQKGITFNAAYEFLAGIAPGWHELPWPPEEDHGLYLDRYIKLNSSLTADAQIDDSLRILTVLSFEIPNFYIKLGDFFFDYNINDIVFMRGGKYSHSWGLASNFTFTNLLARVPDGSYNGDSFIFKTDIPTGIGGFQFLTLTRYNLMGNEPELPKLKDFGYGGKYNLALKWVDFDTGLYWQEGMPLRAFLSIKTTLWKTELYSEGLIAIKNDPFDISGAASFGFTKELFNNKFSINGEVFYNAEEKSWIYTPETYIADADVILFKEKLNIAFNLNYKFGGKTNPSLFTQMCYAPFEDSMQLIPGFKITPLSHIEFYLAVPMTLGSKEGYYYKNAYTTDNKGVTIPFCVILFVKMTGNMQFKH